MGEAPLNWWWWNIEKAFEIESLFWDRVILKSKSKKVNILRDFDWALQSSKLLSLWLQQFRMVYENDCTSVLRHAQCSPLKIYDMDHFCWESTAAYNTSYFSCNFISIYYSIHVFGCGCRNKSVSLRGPIWN